MHTTFETRSEEYKRNFVVVVGKNILGITIFLQLKQCDGRLLSIRVPHDFSRAVRGLEDVKLWKGKLCTHSKWYTHILYTHDTCDVYTQYEHTMSCMLVLLYLYMYPSLTHLFYLFSI